MKQKREKHQLILGVILALLSFILLYYNFIGLGLIAFIVGFLLMNGGKMPWNTRR